MTDPTRHQRDVTRLLLDAVGDAGFALAGSGAIREHGVTSRPTEDVDLFTMDIGVAAFDDAVDLGIAALRAQHYTVVTARRAPQFARLDVHAVDGSLLEVDFGIDWREHQPVRLDVGPVLALEDAISSKVNALYSRAEARDYLDVDAIRRFGRYSDEDLLRIVAERDAGFDREMFADQLSRVDQLTAWEVRQYGVDEAALMEITDRLTEWARSLST